MLVFLLVSCCCHCPISWKRWLRGDYGISIIIIQIHASLLIWEHSLENQGKWYRGILCVNFKASSMGTWFRILLQPVVLFQCCYLMAWEGKNNCFHCLIPVQQTATLLVTAGFIPFAICSLWERGYFALSFFFLFLFYFKDRTAVKIVVKFSFFKYLRGSWQKWTAFFPTSPTLLPTASTLQISSFCKGMTSGLWGKGICQMVLVTVLCCIRQLLEELQGLAGILATLTLLSGTDSHAAFKWRFD